jgi:predicted DNA-binding WGR domain protein
MSEQRTILHERLEWLGANFENKSGKSDKFYEITVTTNGGRLFTETRRWGKYGTKGGKPKVIEHYSEWSALDSAQTKLAKQRDKGYTKPVAPLKRLASLMDD